MPDRNARSVKERFDHGKVGEVSELSARREHDRLRQKINREKGQRSNSTKRRNVQRYRRCLRRKHCPALILLNRTTETITPALPFATAIRYSGAHGARYPRASDSLPKCWKPTAVKRFSMCWALSLRFWITRASAACACRKPTSQH